MSPKAATVFEVDEFLEDGDCVRLVGYRGIFSMNGLVPVIPE